MSLKGQWLDEHEVINSIVSVCHRNSDFHNTDFVIFYGALNVYILVIVILFRKTC